MAKGQEEGWVPCSYLEPLNGGQEEDDTISSLGEPAISHKVTISLHVYIYDKRGDAIHGFECTYLMYIALLLP